MRKLFFPVSVVDTYFSLPLQNLLFIRDSSETLHKYFFNIPAIQWYMKVVLWMIAYIVISNLLIALPYHYTDLEILTYF